MTSTFLSIAERYSQGGLCVAPVTKPGQGEKRPALESWTEYQTRKPTADELRQWFGDGVESIGVFTGDVSGGLEVVDVDDANVVQPYLETIQQWAPGLADRLPQDATPRGGLHLLYRCPGHIAGNQKLARIPDGTDEKGNPKWKTLIETRGQGGFLVVSPTAGRYHATGRPYTLRQGDLTNIPTITPDERAILLDAARVFDEYAPPVRAERPTTSTAVAGKLRPGDDFEQRATWAGILEPHGWKFIRKAGDKEMWRRPGKDGPGASAITGGKSSKTGFGGLFVYSSNAAPFEDGKGYSKFSAYTILNHAGDPVAAARELGRQGYGDQSNGHRAAAPLEDEPEMGPLPGVDDAPPDDGQAQGTAHHLPAIYVSHATLRDMTAASIKALELANHPARLFVRSGALTRIGQDEHGLPVIEPLSEAALRGRLERAADYLRTAPKGEYEPIAPPLPVVRDLAALGAWPFPPLAGIIEAPAIRPDGSVLSEPGYDPATRLYYVPSTGLEMPAIPDNPTDQERQAAIGLLCEVICNFPFDGEASHANALAAMITPVLRPLIAGPVPMVLVDKPQSGTGASLLAEAIALIATGRGSAMMTAPKDDESWRKGITSMLLAGRTVITVDNLEYKLFAPSLAAVLTAATWTDRLLGQNAMVTLPHRATWIGTGNNVRLGGDLPRRCYWSRMDAQQARPWKRTGFKHPDLVAWVKQERGRIVAAILTLARAWEAAGRPEPATLPTIGGFGDWVGCIGGILAHAGIPGFLGNLDQMYDEADDDGPQWDTFLEAWRNVWKDEPVTTAMITKELVDNPTLEEMLPDDLSGEITEEKGQRKASKGLSRRLGKALAARAGMHFPSGRVIRKHGEEHSAKRWKCEIQEKGELYEFGEFTSLYPDSKSSNESVVKAAETNSPNSPNSPDDSMTASTPMMITRNMRDRLGNLGYSVADIDQMTPQKAWGILEDAASGAANDANDGDDLPF